MARDRINKSKDYCSALYRVLITKNTIETKRKLGKRQLLQLF